MSPIKISEDNDFCPYTLFYYPSSRLPPLAMPEDELRQFWCLLDSNDSPFYVDASLKWNMDQLTQAIQKRKNALHDLDTCDIGLLKLNKPIPLQPEETLLQRLPKPISDFSVKLKLAHKVSDTFLDRPRENHIEIIAVTLLDQPPRKKRRLNSSELPEVSEDWNLLWHTFWGVPAPDCFVEDSTHIPDSRTLKTLSKKTNYEYVQLPTDVFFPCGLQRILITETYKTLYTRLCEEEKLYTEMLESKRLASLTHSTIVAGQPGTGKTVGLSCILVWRLQEKKPTIYCSNKLYAYVFTDAGVQQVPMMNGNRIEVLDKSIHSCALVDVNPDLVEVPTQFRPSPNRRGRVVVTTSPNREHIATFKQDQGMTYYTPTWEWADLYCASLVRFSSVDPKELRDAYTKLGGVPRRCFRALSPQGYELETRTIQDAIDNIEDMQKFARSANGSMPFTLKDTHALVRLEPTDATWTGHTTRLLSDHVAQLVYERIRLHTTMKIRDSIEFLLRTPKARGWGGQLFEIAVHRILRDGFAFDAQALDAGAPRLHVKIEKANLQAGNYFHKLSVRAGPRSRKVGNKFLNQYLIPLSSTAEAIDAACISEDVTILFQVTVSPSHDLNLNAIIKLVNELPYDAKKRVCIVFIVPEHDTTCTPYKRQSISIPLGVAKAVSNPVLAYNQYVYYFPMDQL